MRSIDSQGKLTPELARKIDEADSTKRLEDLYLPFKPKKQTLATIARERQLEPLAAEILAASQTALDLDARARDFVNPDKQVNTPADALLGVGHILAEDFGERADLRERLRRILKKSGKLVCTRIESDDKKMPVPRGESHMEASIAAASEAPSEPLGDTGTTSQSTSPQLTPLAASAPPPSSAMEAFTPITSEMGTPDQLSMTGDEHSTSEPLEAESQSAARYDTKTNRVGAESRTGRARNRHRRSGPLTAGGILC